MKPSNLKSTPAKPQEEIFLPLNNISAHSLSETKSQSSRSILSERTDDFASCVSESELQDFEEDDINLDYSSTHTSLSNKVNKRIEFKDPIEIEIKEEKNTNMATKSKATVKPAVTPEQPLKPAPLAEPKTSPAPSTDGTDYAVSQQVYDGVKAAWGYGCEFTVVKPFLKMGEGIAGKVLNLATGIHLEKGDEEIKPKLAEFDDAFVNPAIARLLEALSPVVGKTDETLRPMITIMIKKLYFIPFMPNVEEKKPPTVAEQ